MNRREGWCDDCPSSSHHRACPDAFSFDYEAGVGGWAGAFAVACRLSAGSQPCSPAFPVSTGHHVTPLCSSDAPVIVTTVPAGSVARSTDLEFGAPRRTAVFVVIAEPPAS